MIAVVTPIWRRAEITVVAQRQQALALDGIDAVRVLVGSEGGASRAIAARVGAEYVECLNILGSKLNAGFRWALDAGADRVVLAGSDDMISPEVMRIACGSKADIVGWIDGYRYWPSGSLWYWPGYRQIKYGDHARICEPQGVMRTYSRRVLEAVIQSYGDVTPPDLMRNIDSATWHRTVGCARSIELHRLDGPGIVGLQFDAITNLKRELCEPADRLVPWIGHWVELWDDMIEAIGIDPVLSPAVAQHEEAIGVQPKTRPALGGRPRSERRR